MKTYAERLNFMLSRAKMSQAELARLLGIDQQLINNVCSGITKKPSHVAQIAKHLDCNALWLECGEGEMYPEIILPEQLDEVRTRVPRKGLKMLSRLSFLLADNLSSVDEMTIENMIETIDFKNKYINQVHA